MSDNDKTSLQAAPRSPHKISFEDALNVLERIVASLEQGQVSFDDAIKAFERGTELKSHCQARLEEARMQVEKIKLPSVSEAPDATTPFDPSVS